MDMESNIGLAVLAALILGFAGIMGWMFTTWHRVRHGYPLEGENGTPIYPAAVNETQERVKLLTTENAQLRAELGAIKDRLATVERIVTDSSYGLDREFDALRGSAN